MVFLHKQGAGVSALVLTLILTWYDHDDWHIGDKNDELICLLVTHVFRCQFTGQAIALSRTANSDPSFSQKEEIADSCIPLIL